MSGAGSIEAFGVTQELEVESSGAGKLDLRQLKAKAAEVEVSGAGSVRLGESDTLEVEISGAGTVRYRGKTKITKKDVTGAGKLIKE